MIRFVCGAKRTPLYNTHDARSWTPLGALAYGSVLVVGDVTILLDCGCDVGFEEACFERIGAVAKDVDLVLISHHELRHLGALAAAKATASADLRDVPDGSAVTMYEAWAGYRASFGRDAARSKFTLDDIEWMCGDAQKAFDGARRAGPPLALREVRVVASVEDALRATRPKKLAAEGVKAVFKAGSLVCDGAIVVRKAADDRGNAQLVVDGPLCPEYYAVSRLVQSAFSLV
ncbi:hypothetical protein JL721_12147 [Aureococcus anophagefferens]|nr:hypothetical protein JL721_12147 [Aureococcus anophagefferens]